MRALVDMSDTQVEALDALAREQRRSRASLIRAAIDDYLARHRQDEFVDAFGLWGGDGPDGLTYQEKVRGEW